MSGELSESEYHHLYRMAAAPDLSGLTTVCSWRRAVGHVNDILKRQRPRNEPPPVRPWRRRPRSPGGLLTAVGSFATGSASPPHLTPESKPAQPSRPIFPLSYHQHL